MALLTQFLMLLLIAIGSSLGQCPPREDIRPCFCRVKDMDWYNIRVFCWKVDDVDDVRRALQSVKGIEKVYVEFRDSRLRKVPSDLFKGLNVIHLFFTECIIQKFGDEGRSALEGLEDIIRIFKLEYSFSEDNELKSLNVSALRALEFLDISGNDIKEVGNEWFAEGPANLDQLYLFDNKITRLGDRAFQGLTNIGHLWIGPNNIKTVKRSMFPLPAIHLEMISLQKSTAVRFGY